MVIGGTDRATGQDNGPPHASGKRLLVAEDNPITQDLLKLFLGQRGHHVDIVQDGEQALHALQQTSYHVALLDFHLPRMDGREVALACRSDCDAEKQPWLVAITADVDGLIAQDDEAKVFDQIIPKPLDIHEVCSLVESLPDRNSLQTDADPAAPGQQPQVEIIGFGQVADSSQLSQTSRMQSWIDALGYTFLRWPEDINSTRLSARAMHAIQGDETFDALLVNAPVRVEELAPVWQKRRLHLLPIIDVTGSLGNYADLGVADLGYGKDNRLERLIGQFHQRREELHRDLQFTDETGEKLLGRIHVAGGHLQAAHNPASSLLVSYNTTLESSSLLHATAKLAEAGFLRREFYDRLHVCDRCQSSRFNVREECASCRSANLTEEPYLHHFRCAYQGVESDFKQGEALICPKCRQSLSHFSVDYDKPGSMVRCRDCAHTTSEPAVGFICLDCGSHFDGDAIASRDVYSYALTDQALAFLKIGRAYLGPAQQTLRFSDLPLELVVALNSEARRYNEDRTPFSLFDISYENEREIVREYGPRQFKQGRDLILENLHSLMRSKDTLVRGPTADYALIADVNPDEAREETIKLQKAITRDLRLDLGVRMHVFGPEDFA